MTNPEATAKSDNGSVQPGKSSLPNSAPIDDRLQKIIDRFLYGEGRQARKRSGTS